MSKKKINFRDFRPPAQAKEKTWKDGPIAVSPNRFWAVSVFLGIIFGSMAYNTVGTQLTGIDDANIFLTYANNVSNFEGIVFNVGEQPVEGFTSMLWMLVCSFVSLLTDRPEPGLFGLNVLFVIVTVAVLQWFIQEQLSENREFDSGLERGSLRYVRWCCAIIVFGWVFFSPKFIIWSTITLMDIGIWAMVLAVGTVSFARAVQTEKPNLSTDKMLVVSTILAVLVRPEGTLVAICWWVCLAIARKRLNKTNNVSFFQAAKIPLITLVSAVFLLTAFRLAYFGYLVPNTFNAKVSTDWFSNIWNGLGYLRDFAMRQPWIIAFGLIALIYAVRFFQKPKDEQDPVEVRLQLGWGLVAVSGIVSMLPPILTGGDHFHLSRFFQPAWPIMVVPGIHLFHKYCTSPKFMTQRPLRRILSTSLILVAMFWVAQQPKWEQLSRPKNRADAAERDSIAVEFLFAKHGRVIGSELSSQVNGGLSVAAIRVGGLSLTYNGIVIDLMGLNNLEMAHAPGELDGDKNHAAFKPEVFWKQSPDLVEPHLISSDNEKAIKAALLPKIDSFNDKALKGLIHSERFQSQYVPVIWHTSEQALMKGRIAVWCKRDKVELLTEATIVNFD